MIKKTNNRGFTIVELLIVTTILSVVLLGASFMLIQMGRLYYKGLAASRTQDAARNLVDSIARPLQLGGDSFTRSDTDNTFCIGSNQFNITSDDGAGTSYPEGLKKITRQQITGPCGSATTPASEEALLGENMWLVADDASSVVDYNDPVYTISVRIMYGDRDLMDPDMGEPNGCKGGAAGSQWCASATYTTQVVPRK